MPFAGTKSLLLAEKRKLPFLGSFALVKERKIQSILKAGAIKGKDILLIRELPLLSGRICRCRGRSVLLKEQKEICCCGSLLKSKSARLRSAQKPGNVQFKSYNSTTAGFQRLRHCPSLEEPRCRPLALRYAKNTVLQALSAAHIPIVLSRLSFLC